jgi:hypothetical protein
MFRIASKELFEQRDRLPSWRPGFDSRPVHVSLGTSSFFMTFYLLKNM